ncbi:MAG: tetratricopeptide repeat protein [Myxococcota bacterium]
MNDKEQNPPAAGDENSGAESENTDPAEGQSADLGLEVDVDLGSSLFSSSELPDETSEPPGLFEGDDEETSPRASDSDSDMDRGHDGESDAGEEDTVPGAPAVAASDSDSDSDRAEHEEQSGPRGDRLPAHLQLPSIDFSLPDGAEPSGAASAGTPSGTGDAELPAHLNLPSFPQFELPPVPGELVAEERRLSDGTEVAGIEGAGGSFDDDDEDGADSEGLGDASEDGSDGAENWAVGSAVAPPPPPMPPARKKVAASDSPNGLEALPELPTLKTQAPAKRDPTLLDRQVTPDVKASSRGWMVAAALLFVLAAGVVTAFVYKDTLIDTVADPNEAVDDEMLEAEKTRTRARELWAEANNLYESKQFSDAIARVTESLELDPRFGKSHRLLGVVYAEMKRNDDAVRHYKQYLELEPQAKDAKEVQEIIDDYEAAERKKALDSAIERPKSDNDKRRKRR